VLANGVGGGEFFVPQSSTAASASQRPRREIRPPSRMHSHFLDEHQVPPPLRPARARAAGRGSLPALMSEQECGNI